MFRRFRVFLLTLAAIGLVVTFLSYKILSDCFHPCLQLTTNKDASSELPRRDENQERAGHAKVHCLILTTAMTWSTQGQAVKYTWAKRCHQQTFFYSKVHNISIPDAVALPVPEGREFLTDKIFHALNYTLSHQLYDSEWILKADDDVFIVWENLVDLLSNLSSADNHYIGRVIHEHLSHGYNSGGAGYILSDPVARILTNDFNRKGNDAKCAHHGAVEDVDIAMCLTFFGIFPKETLDSHGFLTFHSDNPWSVMNGQTDLQNVYFIQRENVTFGDPTKGEKMLSPKTISFHHVKQHEIYMLEFLLYELRRQTKPPS